MLIGKTITIKEATNKTITGKHGIVIDETKHTITLQTQDNTQGAHTITLIKEQLLAIEEQP